MRFLFRILQFIIALHFVIVLVYLAEVAHLIPTHPVVTFLKSQYINPYFNQNWRIFAPKPPQSSLKICFKYKVNNIETEWYDITSPIIERNKYFSIDQRMIKYFFNTTDQIKKINLDIDPNVDFKRIFQSEGYQSLRKYAKIVLKESLLYKPKNNSKVYVKIRIMDDELVTYNSSNIDFYDPKNHFYSYFEIPYTQLTL